MVEKGKDRGPESKKQRNRDTQREAEREMWRDRLRRAIWSLAEEEEFLPQVAA